MMRKRRWTACFLMLLGLCLVFGSCGDMGRSAPEAADYAAPESAPAMRGRVAMDKAAMGEPLRREGAFEMDLAESGAADGAGAFTALASTQVDRYLIKNAALSLEVDDAKVVLESLASSIKGAGGYVADMHEQTDHLGARHITLQVRLPADKFEASLLQMEGLGTVLSQRINSQDVTEEFVDTEARVRNLKRTEERLLDHLNRTAKLEDILGVERELTRVRGEIERHEGRLKFLAHRVAFSTITIELHEKAKAGPIVPPKSFSTANEASAALRSLVAFGQRQWVRIIWLGIWAVVWVPLAILAYFLLRRIARAKRSSGARNN